VLVAPVLGELGRPREVEVEVSRSPCRSRGPGEHDAQDVRVEIVVDERAEAEQLACRTRCEPSAYVALGALGARLADPVAGRTELPLEHERVVVACLDLHQQAVEGCNVGSGRVEPGFQRLNERRSRAGERVEDVLVGDEVASDQPFDELRNELAEVRVQPMHVLRPLTLRQLRL
jgi:hypothetical protein